MKAISLSLALVGCQTPTDNLSPQVIYQLEMPMTVNGIKSVGSHVAAPKSQYKLEFMLPKDTDTLLIDSCNGEKAINHPGKKYEYLYEPNDVEKNGYCPLNITAYDLKGSKYLWGYIDFRRPEENLSAVMTCNRVTSYPIGASMCSARVGLSQRLEFSEPVVVTNYPDCPEITATRGVLDFVMVPGTCMYKITAGEKVYRLVTRGYQEIMF